MNSSAPAPGATSRPSKVVLASLLGTTIEWYEFFIYGTAAALLFPRLFFPTFDQGAGTLLSLSSFAIAFLVRPFGGLVFGYIGDRFGRKPTLIATLLLMGVATLGIGLLPTYASIGIAAPVLLVVLRILQGLSLGGEYGGAVLMSVEHARPEHRGFFGALVNTGAGWGLLLANAVFLALAGLPDAAFAAWGWRVPFLLSVVLLVVCFVIRVRISESPEFREAQRTNTTQRTPIARAVLHHWRPMVLMMLAYASAGVTFYIGTVFSLSYGTTALHLPRGMMLTLILLVNVLTIVAIPLFGAWSDRWDRKKIFIGGILGMAALSPVWFAALDTRSFGWILVGFVILFVPYAANYGTMPTFFAQVFPPSVRYTGMSLGYTLGTVISSAVAPLIASGLFEATGSWIPIALYMVGVGIVSAVAALFLSERHATPTHPAADSPAAATGTS